MQQAYYDLIYARENLKVLEKSLELAQQLLSENKKRVEVGVLAPLDEKQAESQVASAKADVLTGRLGYETAQNTLKNLITDDFANWSKGALEPAEQMIALAEKLISEPPKERFDRVIVDKKIESRDNHLRALRKLVKEIRTIDHAVDEKYAEVIAAATSGKRNKAGSDFKKADVRLQKSFPKFFYKQKVIEEMSQIGRAHV